MTEHTAEFDQPRMEWAVEVTWRDGQAAGAKGQTTQYGPFETEGHRDRFLADLHRSHDVMATRVLTRLATYTPWDGPSEPTPITDEDREAALETFWRETFEIEETPLTTPPTPTGESDD